MDSTHSKASASASKTPKRPVTKTHFTENELRHDGPAHCGPVLMNLPDHSTLTFADQILDANGSKHRLALGSIRMAQGLVPLWAHLASDGRVDFHYGANKSVTLKDHDSFVLAEPFCHVTKTPKKIGQTALEALIVFYFVIGGKWSPSIEHKRIQVSLPALKRACKQIKIGNESEHAILTDQKEACSTPPVKIEATEADPSHPSSMKKRKLDDTQADRPEGKRAATATAKERLLQAEVDSQEAILLQMAEITDKALTIAAIHSTWASDVLKGKNIPEGARMAAQIQLEADIEELEATTAEFREGHGRHLGGKKV